MNSTADFQGQMDSSSVIGQRAIRTVLTMWGNKANSSPAVEQEQKETLRRFLAGKAGPVEKERKQSTGILDMKPSSFDSRHDEPAEGRSPKDKAKRWSMLKKVLSKETVNEEHDSDIDASSETGNSNLSHLILDNRHAKVVCRQFGNNPKEIMVVEKEDKIPSPEDRNHVVIKVQVRRGHRGRDAHIFTTCPSF